MENLECRRQQFEDRYPVWEKMTLYRRFVGIAAQCPSSLFFIDERPHTYQDVLSSVNRIAEGLKALGVEEGDCVITALGNCVEFIYITFALAALGAVKVPVNKNACWSEVQYIMMQTEAKVLITEKIDVVEESKICTQFEHIICLDEGCGQDEKIISWRIMGERLCGDFVSEIQENADSLSDIIYTSGSTGQPKGAMLTHDMLLRSAHASCLNRGFEEGRRIYVPLPLFHVYGYVEGLLAAMLVSGSILVTTGKFEADRALKAMKCWSANDILSVPFIMMKLLQYPKLEQYQLEDLHAVYCSASLCPGWVWNEIHSKLQVQEVTTGYGMTEVSGASTQTSPLDDDSLAAGRAGRILNGGCAGIPELGGAIIEYKVIDGATGKVMPPGQYGELICRGPIVTKGYYRDVQANSQAFDPAGWFHTSDVGYFDSDGNLRLLGRCNDIYKINGENVSPQFLDRVISRCPHVRVVETVGVPDEKMGWVGAAFIEADSQEVQIQEEITRYCYDTLAPYQVPRHFFFGDSRQWPRTHSGKVQKFELRELARSMVQKQDTEQYEERMRWSYEHISLH